MWSNAKCGSCFTEANVTWVDSYSIVHVFLAECLPPCTTTEVQTVFIDQKVGDSRDRKNRIDITFSGKIKTYINDYPNFYLPSYLSFVGGALGLEMNSFD